MSGTAPLHARHEGAWGLARLPDVELMHEFLLWLVDDADRFQSAVDSMQWFPPGFSSILIARQADADGTTKRSLQLNLYHEDYPGNEEPHGHSRNARAVWYALPGTRQIISRYAVLGEGAPQLDGADVDEYSVAGNCIIDLKDGRRPLYSPVQLGSRLIVKNSVTNVAPLGSQTFNSTEVHHVGFRGHGVAISAHYKGPEESAALSGMDGLVHYKGLSPEEAELIIDVRRGLADEAARTGSGTETRLGPTTMMYAPVSSGISVEATPVQTPADVAEKLIMGALHTAEKLKTLA